MTRPLDEFAYGRVPDKWKLQKAQEDENEELQEEEEREKRFVKAGSYIAGGRTARVWNVKTFHPRAILQGHDGTNDCLCSADAGTSVECPIDGHSGDVLSVSWAPNGDQIATGR